MSWLLFTLAFVLEICGTTCMKLSEGFSKLAPSVLIFVFYGHIQSLLWPLR
jgi:small multidrug resistance pump